MNTGTDLLDVFQTIQPQILLLITLNDEGPVRLAVFYVNAAGNLEKNLPVTEDIMLHLRREKVRQCLHIEIEILVAARLGNDFVVEYLDILEKMKGVEVQLVLRIGEDVHWLQPLDISEFCSDTVRAGTFPVVLGRAFIA